MLLLCILALTVVLYYLCFTKLKYSIKTGKLKVISSISYYFSFNPYVLEEWRFLDFHKVSGKGMQGKKNLLKLHRTIAINLTLNKHYSVPELIFLHGQDRNKTYSQLNLLNTCFCWVQWKEDLPFWVLHLDLYSVVDFFLGGCEGRDESKTK